jgi:hypothetical protein
MATKGDHAMAQCRVAVFFVGLVIVALLPACALAQDEKANDAAGIESRVSKLESEVHSQGQGAQTVKSELESRVSRLEQKVSSPAESGAVLFLFGAFCALWAQNTGRSPWGWFFLGVFFSVITVAVLLHKNSVDRMDREPELRQDR